MAGSRLARIGTIFARTNGMLKKNVLNADEKPIWFDVYALHPPYEEPRYDRVPGNVLIRDIFYKEDIIRAKFHSTVPRQGTVNLSDNKSESRTQKFIKIYEELKNQGPLDDEKIFQVALEQLNNIKEPKESFISVRDSRTAAENFTQNKKSETVNVIEEKQQLSTTGHKRQPKQETVNAIEEKQQLSTTGHKRQPKQSRKQKLEKAIDVKNLF